MEFNFGQMNNITFNGKEVKSATYDGIDVYTAADFKTVKLNLGSSFHILGIYGNIVAGYSYSGVTITCKTVNLNTGATISQFSLALNSSDTSYTPQIKSVKAVWRSRASNFMFLIDYLLTKKEGSVNYFKFSMKAYYPNGTFIKSYDNTDNGNTIVASGYCNSSDILYFGWAYASGKDHMTMNTYNLSNNNSNFIFDIKPSSSYSAATTITDIYTIGSYAFLRCSTSSGAAIVIYSVTSLTTASLIGNAGLSRPSSDAINKARSWTIYNSDNGLVSTGQNLITSPGIVTIALPSSSYKLIAYSQSSSPITANSTFYLYNTSNHCIYKYTPSSGTYKRLGEAVSSSGERLLDNTQKYMADTSTGIIYNFSI